MGSFKEFYLVEKQKSSMEVFKANKIPLTPEERKIVMDSKSVWHHGPNGSESPAIWKSKNSDGKIYYLCHTHRCALKADTLKKAIKNFEFVKTTA